MAFTYWSAERDDILRRDWPNDMPRAQIKPLIDALPGPAVPLGRISKRALELGLRRGPEFYQVRAAMGAAASRLRQTFVTPERDVLLSKLWAEGVARAEVIAQLNALPGKLVTDRFVSRRAMELGIKRPEGFNSSAVVEAWQRRRVEMRQAEAEARKRALAEAVEQELARQKMEERQKRAPIIKPYRAPEPIDPAPFAGMRKVSRVVGYSMLRSVG